jgi:nitroreductase
MNAAAIRTELDQAARLDAVAREHRQRAGLMLRQAGALQDMHAVAREVGIDSRMVELLLLMAPLSIPSRKT